MFRLLLLKFWLPILGGLLLTLGVVYGVHKTLVHRAVAYAEQAVRNAHNEQLLKASELSREREQSMLSSANKLRKEKDDRLQVVSQRLDAALDGLRQRPPRPTEATSAARDCQGASGSQLSREDAEFLSRESARADRLRASLDQCYQQYDEVRTVLSQ